MEGNEMKLKEIKWNERDGNEVKAKEIKLNQTKLN